MSWITKPLSGNILLAALAITCGAASAQSAPGAAQLNDIKAAIIKSDQQAASAEAATAAAAAGRDQKLNELKAKEVKTPEERAMLRAARTEQKARALAEMTPEVRAAREQARQAKMAQFAASNAAKAAHDQAAAAMLNAEKLNKELADVNKPNPARGADFIPQNVTPLLQRIDTWTKRLAAVKTQNDLAGPKLTELDQGLTDLKTYLERVDNAMVGVQRAGVQTPANKEAEALYLRAGDMLNGLQAEMDRIDKLFPTAGPVQAVFAKFKA